VHAGPAVSGDTPVVQIQAEQTGYLPAIVYVSGKTSSVSGYIGFYPEGSVVAWVHPGYFEVYGTNKLRFGSENLWMRKDPSDGNNIEMHAADWLVCDIAGGMDGIKPDGDETGFLGAPDCGWYEVNSKQFTDIGCLGWFDDGVELVTGEVVSDTEALMRIKKMEDGTRALSGVPRLDYGTLPKAVYRPVYDNAGKLIKERAELTTLISVMIGAIRELTARLQVLEGAR